MKRLLISSIGAFVFYFGWAYWANLSEFIPAETTLRVAIVQGLYSGLMTLGFTLILEKTAHHFRNKTLCLAFLTPFLCSIQKLTPRNRVIFNAFNDFVNAVQNDIKQSKSLIWLAPLVPLAVQSVLVIVVNLINQTPNLWLTVTPSILFSGIYGWVYLIAFLKKS